MRRDISPMGLEPGMTGPVNATGRTVLIVDDDPLFADALRFILEAEGYAVRIAASGEAAIQEARLGCVQVILLDIGLPDIEGCTVCARLREFCDVPIVMVTGRRQERDKIAGLDSGADDYVTKPVAAGELLARIRALRRRVVRADRSDLQPLAAGPVRLDPVAHEIRVRGQLIELTSREYALLEYLLRNVGRAIPRAELFVAVWGPDFFGEERALDVYVHSLRRKIESEPDRPALLQTVRGVGYRLASSEEGTNEVGDSGARVEPISRSNEGGR
jgi:DNA-binding response OmpR family regulator